MRERRGEVRGAKREGAGPGGRRGRIEVARVAASSGDENGVACSASMTARVTGERVGSAPFPSCSCCSCCCPMNMEAHRVLRFRMARTLYFRHAGTRREVIRTRITSEGSTERAAGSLATMSVRVTEDTGAAARGVLVQGWAGFSFARNCAKGLKARTRETQRWGGKEGEGEGGREDARARRL